MDLLGKRKIYIVEMKAHSLRYLDVSAPKLLGMLATKHDYTVL